MKLRVIALAFAIIAMACGSAMAQISHIGIYADAAGTSCDITAAQYVPTQFFILAKPNVADTAGGVNGAEFRITGGFLDGADAIVVPAANPASNVALGNPFENPANTPDINSPEGCNISFPSCQTVDANGFVVLYTVTITILNLANVADIEMEVLERNPPSNASQANFSLINACDGPVFTAVQTSGGKAYLNHSTPGACTDIAVEEKTWGQVKAMYSGE